MYKPAYICIFFFWFKNRFDIFSSQVQINLIGEVLSWMSLSFLFLAQLYYTWKKKENVSKAMWEVNLLEKIATDLAIVALITGIFLLYSGRTNQFCKVQKNMGPLWKRQTILDIRPQ